MTNEDAVKKLVEAMKGKMENKTYPSSSTAKPTDNFTLNEVIIDFMDELHTAILKIQQELTRKYEQQKLERLKSAQGQKEDLERLNQGVVEQNA